MIEWVDVTGSFSEERRHWKGRYLEICEVAFDEIECSLFSNKDDDWEIYVNYGIMQGISYVSAANAENQYEQIKKEIEDEFNKNKFEPSKSFINSFCRKYEIDFINVFF